MRHAVIMSIECYKSSSGRLKGLIVSKSSMGIETRASFNEYRYVTSGFENGAIEQALSMQRLSNPNLTFKVEEFS